MFVESGTQTAIILINSIRNNYLFEKNNIPYLSACSTLFWDNTCTMADNNTTHIVQSYAQSTGNL